MQKPSNHQSGKSPMIAIHVHAAKEPKHEGREVGREGSKRDELSDMAQQQPGPPQPGASGPEAALVKMVQQMAQAGMKPEEIMAQIQKLLGGAGQPQMPSPPQAGGTPQMLDQMAMMGR